MEGHCSTGQSPQWAVVPGEEDEEEEEEETIQFRGSRKRSSSAGSEKMEIADGR